MLHYYTMYTCVYIIYTAWFMVSTCVFYDLATRSVELSDFVCLKLRIFDEHLNQIMTNSMPYYIQRPGNDGFITSFYSWLLLWVYVVMVFHIPGILSYWVSSYSCSISLYCVLTISDRICHQYHSRCDVWGVRDDFGLLCWRPKSCCVCFLFHFKLFIVAYC